MNYLEHFIKVRSNNVPKIRYYFCTATSNQNAQLHILDVSNEDNNMEGKRFTR